MSLLDFDTAWATAHRDPRATIDALHLSTRAYNALRRGGIHTLRRLADSTDRDLLDIRSMGPGTLAEIETALARTGFSLRSVLSPA